MKNIIEVNNVSFEYITDENTLKAIDNLDLQVKEGEFVAIIGHNGSGKSTLSKNLNAILFPTEGNILINKMDTREEDKLWDIRQTAGMVFQNPDNQIVATVVEEDVAFGPENLGIEPNEIRYSQSSANGSSDIIQSMKANGWQGDPIDVVEMPDGIYTTIDNTRVVSAREAGINVEANVHGYNDPLPSEYIERFTTKKGVPKTWGEAIELRVSKQKASFRNGNPYGKLEMETIK